MSHSLAIVTGAASHTGAAVARRYARSGKRVVIVDIDDVAAERVAAEINCDGWALAAHCDIGSEAEVATLFSTVVSRLGGLEFLINCAGPYFPQDPLRRWKEIIDINLLGALSMTNHAIAYMRDHGGGSIVNIASDSGLGFGAENQPAYGAAKAGIMRFTAALRWLGDQHGIRVNCITPDWIGTEAVRSMIAALTPTQCRELCVPDYLITEDEFADIVHDLSLRKDYAGRVVLCWSGKPLEVVRYGDRGYVDTDSYR